MKRFYTDVAVRQDADGWQVTLDGRGIKTVKGSPQVLPSPDLANHLAQEWSEQNDEIDPERFVFRDMADYAIDIIAPDRNAAIVKLLAYGETDTLCYRADPEDPLYARQQDAWEPIVTAIEDREGFSFTRVSGIMHRPQSDVALAGLRARIEPHSAFVLAGMETMASLAASLIIAISANEPDADVEALWRAATLEEEWQAELWGRDHEAEQRRARRRDDFLKAAQFVALARG